MKRRASYCSRLSLLLDKVSPAETFAEYNLNIDLDIKGSALIVDHSYLRNSGFSDIDRRCDSRVQQPSAIMAK